MCELTSKQRIQLAKIIQDDFSTGDWRELFVLTDCEHLNDNERFFNDVRWGNDGLKDGCIRMINIVLNKNNDNIIEIWNFDNGRLQQILKRKDISLYNYLEAQLSGIPQVEIPIIKKPSETMKMALEDAELLFKEHGADRAYDRVHTAFHSYLRSVCTEKHINFNKQDSISDLYKKISDNLKINNNVTYSNVEPLLKTIGSILGHLDNMRNNHSLAHGNEKLLLENNARFLINLIKSTMGYLEGLLN